MRILVVGGTRFVGRPVVEGALAAGHEVTLLHRGITGRDDFPGATHVYADRDDEAALHEALAGRSYDASVDLSAYTPYQVSTLADALGDRGGRHLFVSTVSVYAPPPGPGYTESAPLLPPTSLTERDKDMARYGERKVACELVAAQRHGTTLAIVRPTYVIGPHDYSWRFPWWVHRIAAGGDVLCPGPYDQAMQVIDARDQGAFMLGLLEHDVAGTFHTASPQPPFSFGEMLDAIASVVAPAATRLHWVGADELLDRGLDERTLPLWHWGEPDAWVMAADASAALAAGLQPRPLTDSVRDTAGWLEVAGPVPAGTGLDPQTEARLLAR